MTESAIKTYVLKLAGEHAATNLIYRYRLGAAAIDLQRERNDIGENGRPAYGPARAIITRWIEDAGYEVSENTLKSATYIAARLTVDQINILARRGMLFCQVYNMLRANKDNEAAAREYVEAVGEGEETDFPRWNRAEQVKGKGKPQEAQERGIVELTIRGNETREQMIDKVVSVLSAARRMGLDWANMVNEAKGRLK